MVSIKSASTFLCAKAEQNEAEREKRAKERAREPIA